MAPAVPARPPAGARRRIAYFLRDCGNVHYFAALKPYLDYFQEKGGYDNRLVVRVVSASIAQTPDYAGYEHLFSSDSDLDGYDLVLTPTFLRPADRGRHTRAVQVFHGMSDKAFTHERDFRDYELCLCSGQRQVDRLLKYAHNREINWRIVGYPKFDHPPIAAGLFGNGRRTAIYCPTWRKEGISSLDSFLDDLAAVARLAERFNVIVKPHPNTFNPAREHYDAGIVGRLAELDRMANLRVVRAGNVMPWYAQADVYVGDISASGYEWLYFDRPMVFLNPRPGALAPSTDIEALTYLWQCGEVCERSCDLPEAVARSLAGDRYRPTRERILAYSVHRAREGGATRRGADCIEQLLESSALGRDERRPAADPACP